ncbi:E3 ubiquitin/ISG15 ligase TRIM25 isoform X2 [Xenopus laevis]|uniref:E3 ubiquitin/ISG15 ligase TRIM25 isoform X2 n=1 Tax=Xenopus laevis TaxID=8355 RepID=A0A8J0TWX7_XENLA|nr:E3 ubiquitin/ISG15 ligase TRIM25 isoform X2 [Xenopus laevis]
MENLVEELTCSICLGLFSTPVTIPCGHNFCGGCLNLAWEASKKEFINILQSLNQKIEKASNTADEVKREQRQVMNTADKKKNLMEGEFEEIKALIEQEKKKSIRKIEEEENKANSKFSYTLSILGKKKQEFEKMKSSVESLLQEDDDLQFLKQASKLHDTTSKEPFKPKTEFDEKLLHQIFRNTVSLKDFIKTKLQQPDDISEKLPAGGRYPKQDDTLESSRAYKVKMPAGGSRHPKQEDPLENFLLQMKSSSTSLEKMQESRHPKQTETPDEIRFTFPPKFGNADKSYKKEKPRFKVPSSPSVPSPDGKNNPQVNTKRGPPIPDSREEVLKYAEQLTVNPNTAHKRVLLSERNTKLFVSDKVQDYQDHPERFTHCSQVLCSQGFSQGIHYWEVEIQGGNFSGFGVACRSIPRKGGESRLGRNNVSWCLEYFNGKLQAWHDEKETSLTSPNTNRIGVLLNYDEGFLSFFSVSKKFSQIYRFRARFTEVVYPAFWVFSANAVLSLNTFN